MKTTLLAIVLAVAFATAAQTATQAQTPAAPASADNQAPTIKDAAEYNAYVGAVQQTDPTAKISALEAFVVQYPNSVMKETSLEQLMAAYLGKGDQPKAVDAAKRLLVANPCNLRGLVVITSLARQGLQSGQNVPQNLADLSQNSDKGIDCEKTAPRPATITDADWQTLKKGAAPLFEGGAGFAALQGKDFAKAATHLRAAIEAEPTQDPLDVYYLGFALLSEDPPDSVNGLFFIARAASLTSGAGQTQIQEYGRKKYKNYHGSEEGWNDGPNSVISLAKADPLPPAAFTISKYVPPTPAEQAHDLVKDKTPDQIKQLSFGEWELVLSAGTQDDQDKVWNVIKGVPLQMEGTVLTASTPEVTPPDVPASALTISASEDDIEQKVADITITMTGVIPVAKMPKSGDTLDFEGTPVSYVPSPFMMTMERGALLKKAGEKPAPKATVHHHPVHKPQ
jgi:hypothetical protein